MGIRAELHDTDNVKLQVNDTGIGIKAEEVGRLFKEFEQLESGVSRRYEGTGLGLALTQKIVRHFIAGSLNTLELAQWLATLPHIMGPDENGSILNQILRPIKGFPQRLEERGDSRFYLLP